MKRQNGITLIALIITIIVMLILVGVTVSVALNGGLFDTTKEAARKTQIEADREILQAGVIGALNKDLEIPSAEELQKNLPEGWQVTGNGPFTCTSPKENIFTVEKNGNINIEGEETPTPPVDLPDGWNKDAIGEIITETVDGTEYKVPIPKGFVASKANGESKVAQGLVIYEGTEEVNDSNVETAQATRNQFVWIPVKNAVSYTEDSFGPLTGTELTSHCVVDSQDQLDYYYGEGFFNYAEDFTYEDDKTKIEENIQTYGGFYVGRYETTIDGNTIGVQKGKTVLTAETIIKEGTNPNIFGAEYEKKYNYRWYGLYKVQKDMYANNESVGSLMISSKQWDAIIEHTGYEGAKRERNTYTTEPDLSGSAYKDVIPTTYDESKNIYDLAGNLMEWTMMTIVGGADFRVLRGCDYTFSYDSASSSNNNAPSSRSRYNR